MSTIIHADEILVLKDGIIVERGRHETLVNNKGVYAAMWNQQLQSLDTTDPLKAIEKGGGEEQTPTKQMATPSQATHPPRHP